MNIRQAIFKTADLFEASPEHYDFDKIGVPGGPGCGTPGCVLGWTAFFMGKTYKDLPKGLNSVLDVNARSFYFRMSSLCGNQEWIYSAAKCAETIRLYADKYFPEEATEKFPAIRAELDRIFEAVTC